MDKPEGTQKLRVGFVAEPYEESKASGMGYSVMETIRGLAAHEGPYELTLYSSKPIDRSRVPGSYKNVLIPKSFAGQFWYFLRMKKEVDVLFFVVALLPFWIPKKVTTVVVCKELTNQTIKPEGFAEWLKIFMRDSVLMPRCIRNAKFVLASSEATKADVMKYYAVPAERIKIIYEGYQEWGLYKDSAPSSKVEAPYFLFAGKIKPRKNVHGIVRGFIEYKERTKSNAKLLLVGSKGGEFYESLVAEAEANGMASDIVFLGYVSGPEMYTLFTHALAFVFPSLNEGFGMPIVEAMSLGVPVITSNISSLTEVAADAAIQVDPYDVHAISAVMEQIANSGELRSALIAKGYERAKLFSWAKVAERYVTIIESLRTHAV